MVVEGLMKNTWVHDKACAAWHCRPIYCSVLTETSFSDDEGLASYDFSSRSVLHDTLIAATVWRSKVTDSQHGSIHRQGVTEILLDYAPILVPCDHVISLLCCWTVQFDLFAISGSEVCRCRRVICTSASINYVVLTTLTWLQNFWAFIEQLYSSGTMVDK